VPVTPSQRFANPRRENATRAALSVTIAHRIFGFHVFPGEELFDFSEDGWIRHFFF
jgi:hypothetical protein